MLMVKNKNKGKVDSHFWLLQGVYPYLEPEFVHFFDIGTIAKEGAITNLYKFMKINEKCGGAAGEIEVFWEHPHSFYVIKLEILKWFIILM